jgi:hypothetical protein
MAKPGRVSSAQLAISKVSTLETLQRPDAPYELTDEQSAEWWAVVNRMPADWFPRETHGLLTQYCRHVVNARRVAQLITKCEKQKKLDVNDYNQLLIMQEREGRAISSLATRMRLTQQTVHDREKKKPHQVAKPWET